MKIKKINLKNIRSYLNHEIEFPEGSLLLSGDVGSGKTSILLAIEYALFGLQPGQKGSSLLRNNSELGEVNLEIEIAGKSILIERKLKKTSKGVANDYSAITIDNEKTEHSITELKSKIVSLLGYPPEFIKKNNTLFRYTVYTPQEQMKQIIKEEPEQRLNILRHIFGIDKYKRIRENLAIFLNTLKTNLKVLQFEMSTLDKDKEDLNNSKLNLETIKQKISEIEKQLSEKTKEKIKSEQEFQAIQRKIEEKRKFEKEAEKTQIMISSKKENLNSTIKEMQEIEKNLKEEKEQFNQNQYLQILKQITSAKEKIEKLNAQLMEISTKIISLEKEKKEKLSKKERIFQIDICPTCLQNVSEIHKCNILNETEKKSVQINSELSHLEKEKIILLRQFSEQNQSLNILEEQKTNLEILKSKIDYLERAKDKLKFLQKQEKIYSEDLNLLSEHIKSLKETILKYSTLQNQLNKKQEDLNNSIAEERNAEITIAELKKELELSSNSIQLLKETILQKENSRKKTHALQELIDWLSNQFLSLIDFTEKNILMKLRIEFSSIFRKWFLLLIPENSLDSRIDENFTPIILQGETEMDYGFLSGGERTAIALAYRLALNQTLNSVFSTIKTRGIIILDEPTDGFSDIQINKVRDIIEELNAEQIILVSHEPKIESFVDNVLRVSKQNGNSEIETQL